MNSLITSAVLFDLDGTLLDSASSLMDSLAVMAKEYNRPAPNQEAVRAQVSLGSPGLLSLLFNVSPGDIHYEPLRQRFFDIYARLSLETHAFFPGVYETLNALESKKIPWGIVTNKVTQLTVPLLENANLLSRCQVLICGDTLPEKKPSPLPLLQACKELDVAAEQVLFVGDGVYDYQSAVAANIRFVLAAYGYPAEGSDMSDWSCFKTIEKVEEILDCL